MTQELFSTSAPVGLEAGNTGYCTVAMTRGIARPLVEVLEALSAYRPVYMPGDEREDDNPVAWSHLRLAAGGRAYTVLSRVAFAGLDHTARTNRFAHHVVLGSNDPRPPGGPAWLLGQPGFMEQQWDGQVRWLSAGRAVPSGDLPPAICRHWAESTGDPGWAGVVLERLVEGQTVYLAYEPGDELLPLIADLLALLPPERRWNVSFTTYFTGLPQGILCLLRGVVRGSPEAQAAPRGTLLDLTTLSRHAPPASDWVEAARGARRIPEMAPMGQATMTAGPRLAPVPAAPPPPPRYEAELDDGPLWREPLGTQPRHDLAAPPAQHHHRPPEPVPPPPHVRGPVLTPVSVPEADLEAPPAADETTPRRGVGMGVVAGLAIGLVVLAVAGVAAVALKSSLKNHSGKDQAVNKEKDRHRAKQDDGAPDRDRGKPDGATDYGQLALQLQEPEVELEQSAGRSGPVLLGVTPEKEAGTFPILFVEVRVNGKTVQVKPRGHDQVELSGLPVGTHTITAGLQKNKDYRAGESRPVTLTVKWKKVSLGRFLLVPLGESARPGGQFKVELKWDERRSPGVVFKGGKPVGLDWERFEFKGRRELELGRQELPAFTGGAPIRPAVSTRMPGVFLFPLNVPPGNYELTARYPGDDRYHPSDAAEPLVVKVEPPVLARREPEIRWDRTGKGRFSVHVIGHKPTGKVHLVWYRPRRRIEKVLASAPLVDGKATLAVPADLDPGIYQLWVSYSGDKHHEKAERKVAPAYVVGPRSAVDSTPPGKHDVTVSAKKSGDQVAVTVAGKGKPGGTVQLVCLRDGKPRPSSPMAPLADGKATLKVPDNLPEGKYQLQVAYSGDEHHAQKTVEAGLHEVPRPMGKPPAGKPGEVVVNFEYRTETAREKVIFLQPQGKVELPGLKLKAPYKLALRLPAAGGASARDFQAIATVDDKLHKAPLKVFTKANKEGWLAVRWQGPGMPREGDPVVVFSLIQEGERWFFQYKMNERYAPDARIATERVKRAMFHLEACRSLYNSNVAVYQSSKEEAGKPVGKKDREVAVVSLKTRVNERQPED